MGLCICVGRKGEKIFSNFSSFFFFFFFFLPFFSSSRAGTIFITQAQTFFRNREGEGIVTSVPHGTVERLRKVQGKEKTGTDYIVDLICKV